MSFGIRQARSLRREDSFSGFFFFENDCFGRADLCRKQDLFVGVGFGVDHFGDHLGVELKDFGRRLHALGVAVAFGSIDRNLHKTSCFNSIDSIQSNVPDVPTVSGVRFRFDPMERLERLQPLEPFVKIITVKSFGVFAEDFLLLCCGNIGAFFDFRDRVENGRPCTGAFADAVT
jgi:hypothetical protein